MIKRRGEERRGKGSQENEGKLKEKRTYNIGSIYYYDMTHLTQERNSFNLLAL
jgi:hypothetical protein